MLKYFLIFAILLVLLTLFADISMVQTVETRLLGQNRSRLTQLSSSAARFATKNELTPLSPELSQFADSRSVETGDCFEILDEDGQLVYSAKPVGWQIDELDSTDLSNKPEVISSLQTGSGLAERNQLAFSTTSFNDAAGSPVGMFRVIKTFEPEDYLVQTLRKLLWCFSGLIGILAAISMALFSRTALQPLSQFAHVARQIGTGQMDSVPSLHGRQDDWGALSDAFRYMQTELKRREVSILDNSSRLQAVLSSMIEGVVAIDHRGNVMLANGAACQMLGLSHGEVYGRDFLEIFRNPELTNAITRTQKERFFSSCEIQTLDEPRRTISARVSVLTNETGKKRPGVAIVLHDITDIRQLENMRRDFVANVSHELKTPLSSIRAYAETLKMGAINDQEKNLNFVMQIEQQADVLNEQIQELLQLARVESGQENWEIQPVAIDEICESLLKQFSSEAEGRGISLQFMTDHSNRRAKADHNGVRTILGNLITNALHYTAEGGHVEVNVKAVQNEVQIEVIDDGIGIPHDHQDRIFERFYRVDASRSRDMGGTGLGLSIVKHLCLAFQGSVDLESSPGKGSRFIVRLPAVAT